MDDLKNIFMERGGQAIFLMGIRGISLVSKFALTLFIARFMGFETLGLYGLITAASIVVPVFLGLGLMYTISRKAVTQSQLEIVQNLKHYGVYTTILYAVIFIGAVSAGIIFDKLFLILVVALVIFLEHLNNDIYGLLLNLSKPIRANFLHFIRTALWILVFMGCAFFFPEYRTIEYLLLGWGCGSAVSLLGFTWIARRWPWFENAGEITLIKWVPEEFKQSKIIYMDSLANTVGSHMNFYIVTFFLGLELTGVYVFFAQIISAMSNLIETGVMQISRPKMVRTYKERNPSYDTIHLKCVKHTALLSVVMAFFATIIIYPITFYLVDKPGIVEWFPVFWIMLIGFVILMYRRANDLVFYSQHRDNLILKLNLIATTLGMLLNLFLIGVIGFLGVALGGVIVAPIVVIIQYRMMTTLKEAKER